MMKKVDCYVCVPIELTGVFSESDKSLDVQMKTLKKYMAENGMEAETWFMDVYRSGEREKRDDLLKPGILKTGTLLVADDSVLVDDPAEWFWLNRALIIDCVEYSMATRNEYAMKQIDKYIRLSESSTKYNKIGLKQMSTEKELGAGGKDATKKRQARKEGHYAGGRPPYGYCAGENGLEKSDEEGAVVNRIFTMKFKGIGFSEAQKRLDAAGVISARTGKPLSGGTMRNLWYKNYKVYKGYVKQKDGTWVKGDQEPYLDEDGRPFEMVEI